MTDEFIACSLALSSSMLETGTLTLPLNLNPNPNPNSNPHPIRGQGNPRYGTWKAIMGLRFVACFLNDGVLGYEFGLGYGLVSGPSVYLCLSVCVWMSLLSIFSPKEHSSHR